MISRFFSSFTGYDLSQAEMLKAGERIQVLERYMNTLMGITRKDDTLPKRFLIEEETRHAVKSTVPLEPMLDKFYKLRGYDENGIPRLRLLRNLGIEVH
jgi:aldehyde:ferredoxin oxidoreductase